MTNVKKAMLETAFKTGYEAGYVDEQGFLLKSIPMEDFNALQKHGMVKQVGEEFQLCSPVKKRFNGIWLYNLAEFGIDEESDEAEDFLDKWNKENAEKIIDIIVDEIIRVINGSVEDIKVKVGHNSDRGLLSGITFNRENLKNYLHYELGDTIDVELEFKTRNTGTLRLDFEVMGIDVDVDKEISF